MADTGNTNRTSEVMLATLTQDVAHIVTMLAELKTSMAAADTRHSDRLEKLKTELSKADDTARSELVKADEQLRADMRTAIQELKDLQGKHETRLTATDEKATQAKDSSSRMVWVTVGVLSVLVAFAAALLIAKLTGK